MTFATLPLPLAGLSSSEKSITGLSLPLLALTLGLLVLCLAFRTALQPHRKALAVAVTTTEEKTPTDDITSSTANTPVPVPTTPSQTTVKQLVKRWGWAALDKLALFLEALEDDEDEEAPAPAVLRKSIAAASTRKTTAKAPNAPTHQRRWTLDGTSYRLPSAPRQTPKPTNNNNNTHRRSQSLHGSPSSLNLKGNGQQSYNPVQSTVFSPPPQMRQIAQGTPITGPGARPLSAAKLIMSRHIVRKPYRSPPVPGQPRTTPISKLAS